MFGFYVKEAGCERLLVALQAARLVRVAACPNVPWVGDGERESRKKRVRRIRRGGDCSSRSLRSVDTIRQRTLIAEVTVGVHGLSRSSACSGCGVGPVGQRLGVAQHQKMEKNLQSGSAQRAAGDRRSESASRLVSAGREHGYCTRRLLSRQPVLKRPSVQHWRSMSSDL